MAISRSGTEHGLPGAFAAALLGRACCVADGAAPVSMHPTDGNEEFPRKHRPGKRAAMV